jgi:hypothetical protein
MDITSLGIVLGLAASALYTLIRAIRQRSFDIGVTILCFLAGFSFPPGGALIAAGLRGEVSALPGSWREYVAVAGVAGIGLASQYLIVSCRGVWAKPASAGAINEGESSEQQGTGVG